MGYWAKFKYGGRSAHYFNSDGDYSSLCGRLVIDGRVKVFEFDSLKGNRCVSCFKAYLKNQTLM